MTTEIFFISSNQELTKEQFNEHYVPELEKTLKNPLNKYVVGDANSDFMVQEWLFSKRVTSERVTIHHTFNKPKYIVPAYERNTRSGYSSEEARDEMMTLVSTKDIALVGDSNSRTAKNIIRRDCLKHASPSYLSSPEREELESMSISPTYDSPNQYRLLYFIAQTLVGILEELRSKR